MTNIINKKKIIKNFNYLIKWLENNIEDANSLNKIYFMIYIYKNNNKLNNLNDKNKHNLFVKKIENAITKKIRYNEDIICNNSIDYKQKIELTKTRYLDISDLEIKFLPNFLDYESYICILVWILFCKVNNKESTKPNHFLYDIYLFQNETNNYMKINHLIIILQKMQNYIQYFDYKKK